MTPPEVCADCHAPDGHTRECPTGGWAQRGETAEHETAWAALTQERQEKLLDGYARGDLPYMAPELMPMVRAAWERGERPADPPPRYGPSELPELLHQALERLPLVIPGPEGPTFLVAATDQEVEAATADQWRGVSLEALRAAGVAVDRWEALEAARPGGMLYRRTVAIRQVRAAVASARANLESYAATHGDPPDAVPTEGP